MQVPNRPIGTYGYSVRNYAPASVYPHYQGSQCAASSTKPPSGKSFTIEALLAKPEDTASDRTSPPHCGVKYQLSAPVLPLTGHAGLPMAPAPYVYSPNMMHSAIHHTQPGYSVYCCPPFTYQASCRGAFYAQGKIEMKNEFGSNKHKRPRSCGSVTKGVVFFCFSPFLCSFNVQNQCRAAFL